MGKQNNRRKGALTLLFLGLSGVAAMAAPAYANDTVDAIVGNVWVWTSLETGDVVKDYLTADGKFTMDTGASGTWTLDGDELCLAEATGAWAGCVIVPQGRSVGDSFEMTGFDGNRWMTEILAK